MIGNCSPTLPRQETEESEFVPPLEIGEPVVSVKERVFSSQTVIDITPPLSSFHYQVNKVQCFSRLYCMPLTHYHSHGVSLIMSIRCTKNLGLLFIPSHG
jgi:hypothetical protein